MAAINKFQAPVFSIHIAERNPDIDRSVARDIGQCIILMKTQSPTRTASLLCNKGCIKQLETRNEVLKGTGDNLRNSISNPPPQVGIFYEGGDMIIRVD